MRFISKKGRDSSQKRDEIQPKKGVRFLRGSLCKKGVNFILNLLSRYGIGLIMVSQRKYMFKCTHCNYSEIIWNTLILCIIYTNWPSSGRLTRRNETINTTDLARLWLSINHDMIFLRSPHASSPSLLFLRSYFSSTSLPLMMRARAMAPMRSPSAVSQAAMPQREET